MLNYSSKEGNAWKEGASLEEEKRAGGPLVEEVKVPITVTVVPEVVAKGATHQSEKRHPSSKGKLPRSPQATSYKAPVLKDSKPRKSMMNSTLPADRLQSFKKDPKGSKGGKGGKPSKKQERHVKMHIETLMKGRPIRFRVIAFAQRVAALKIQRIFRWRRQERIERARRILEAKQRDFCVRVATKHIQEHVRSWIVRKRFRRRVTMTRIQRQVRLWLARRRFRKRVAATRIQRRVREWIAWRKHLRELLEYMTGHERTIVYVQQKFRLRKNQPKKMNIRRFKALILSLFKGWSIRRRIRMIKNDPECKEAFEVLRLVNDMRKDNSTDMFFKSLLNQLPRHVQKIQETLHSMRVRPQFEEDPPIRQRKGKKQVPESRQSMPSRLPKEKEARPQEI